MEPLEPPTPSPCDDDALLASIGLELGGRRHALLRAAAAPVMRRIREEGVRVIGFAPADAAVAVPPLLLQLGLALCEATGGTVAVVDANVRYSGLPMLAHGRAPDHAGSVFSTRGRRGSLALLTPPRVERAGEVVPQLTRALREGADLFGHVLVDLTGLAHSRTPSVRSLVHRRQIW